MEVKVLYNIYCDESCHLQYDKSNVMALGAIVCPNEEKSKVYNDIRNIKIKHGVSSWSELKWTKISNTQIELYKELVYYFFNNENLSMRIIVAEGKDKLDNDKYNDGEYNTWYYKMYFRLLDPLIDETENYRVFIDIKDTRGGPKIRKLHESLP